ncbi:non-ribosomal peptide synthetase [Pedobacter sp. AW31-3R]|uniref:non-ribosomal peptide synthetase n=1 Tax=Pedobacter sp. AW31-3R TaxID=3445781 RepID=UPI003FA0A828
MSQYTLTPVDYDPFDDPKEIASVIFTNEPQKEIWISCILGGSEASLAYNESVSLDFNGRWNNQYFMASLQEVISRHEILRATVSANGENLIIYRNFPNHTVVADISAAEDKQVILENFISEEMQREFDFENGPLFRFFIHKLSETNFLFTIVVHHIIADGWSLGVILEDLSKLYNAKTEGRTAALEAAPQISSYAKEQADFATTAAFQKTKKFWLDMYRDTVPVLNLPLDYPRRALRTYKANRIDYKLPMQLIEKLKLGGAKAGCSLVNTLLAAFEIFLYQQTNQRDLVIGLPAAGQATSGNLGLVGHCVNLLPIRSTINPQLSFVDFLKNRKKAFFDAYDNQNFTYGQLLQLLNIKRDSSRVPLVPVVFNIDMGMDSDVAFNELDFKLISNARQYETFEIFLNVTGSASEFILEWSYNTQLFKKERIEKMSASFDLLIQSIVADPSVTIKELSAINNDILLKKLEPWNNTAYHYPRNCNLASLINQAALKFPHKNALVLNNKTLSYGQLIQSSNQLCSWLKEKGIKGGDIVGLSAKRSIEMVVSMLAIIKSGAAYLPLDPEYPHERLHYMIEQSDARMILVSKAYSGSFHSGITEVVIEDLWPSLVSYSSDTHDAAVLDTDLLYVLFTSGSTGKPKGVKISHQNMINFLVSMQHEPGIKSSDRVLAITTISFDISGLEIYLPLIAGAELVICETDTARDGRLLLESIDHHQITFMQATPPTWRMLLDSGWTKKYPLKVLCGGEAFPEDVASRLLEKTSEVWNMYGPTETTVWSTVKRISSTDDPITIGTPIYNTKTYIVNENFQLVAPGNPGELLIGGDGLSSGYINQPELTSERFVDDPYHSLRGHQLYRTGDLAAYTENGEIILYGRIDQQVKIRGHRIELGEIEAQLLSLKEVKQAVVVVREDSPGNKRMVAYVILKQEHAAIHEHVEKVLAKQVTDHWKKLLRLQLPDYMIPSAFVVLKDFPLTPNYKIDKKALPPPEQEEITREKSTYTSRNEKLIADIWAEVLKLKNIGASDDFFELGGHSLLAVKVMAAIEKTFGKRLPLATLFENSTIEKLAGKIEAEREEKWNVLVPIKTSGNKNPAFMIHGGGLNVLLYQSISKLMDEDQPVYGLQALGLNKTTQLKYSMEEIAAAYVAEITEVNPNDSYCLVGYSLGGLIAFEMAKQLLTMGKKIHFLGVIDTYTGNIKTVGGNGDKSKILRQLHKIPFIIRSFIAYPMDTLRYQTEFFMDKIKNMFSDEIKSDNEYLSKAEEEIYKSYHIAHENFVMSPADVKVSLFKAKKRLYYLDDPIHLGWDKFAGRGVDIYVMPGDHETFMKPPLNKGFAKALQSAIDKSVHD